MAVNDFFSILKDICLSGAAITTATVAWRGVSKWKNELRGKVEFEVGRGLILTTYKLRNAIDNCRNPFLSASEYPEDYSSKRQKMSFEEKGQATGYLYNNRLKEVLQCIQEFDAATLETEALWGSPVSDRANKLRDCVSELKAGIWMYVNNDLGGGEIFKSDKELAEEIKAIVMNIKQEKNPFTLKVNKAVEEIEKYVRPHLSRRKQSLDISKFVILFKNELVSLKEALSRFLNKKTRSK